MRRELSPSFTSFLDLARALAAISVFLEHLRDPIFPGWGSLPQDQQTLAVRAWFFVTGFGFEAVMIFFVLSGFLVGGLGLGKIRDSRWTADGYFIDRLSRLFVVLIPALLLTLLLDRSGQSVLGVTGFWDGTNPILGAKFSASFLARGSSSAFLCNLGMLQSFYCQVYGSNIPLWTLSYEFWFYVTFGAVAAAFVIRTWWRAIAVLALIAILWILGAKFLWMLSIWLLGVLAYAYSGDRLRWPAVALPLWLLLAVVSRLRGVGEPDGDMLNNLIRFAEGAAFAWVVISVRNKDYRVLRRLSGIGQHLASFSYTLYLIHFPLMLFLIAAVSNLFGLDVRQGLNPHSMQGVAFYVGIFVAVMTLAWVVGALTEANTQLVREWMRGCLRALRRSIRALPD